MLDVEDRDEEDGAEGSDSEVLDIAKELGVSHTQACKISKRINKLLEDKTMRDTLLNLTKKMEKREKLAFFMGWIYNFKLFNERDFFEDPPDIDNQYL